MSVCFIQAILSKEVPGDNIPSRKIHLIYTAFQCRLRTQPLDKTIFSRKPSHSPIKTGSWRNLFPCISQELSLGALFSPPQPARRPQTTYTISVFTLL